MLRVDLRRLILWLCLASVLVALANGIYASYLVQRQMLIANNLESNRVYAQKMAALTDGYLADSRKIVAFAASQLSTMDQTPSSAMQVVSQLLQQTTNFNSALIVNAEGFVVATAPATIRLVGQPVQSERIRAALKSREPIVSKPFKAVTGRWVVVHTYPIFSNGHRYLGLVMGVIYLHEINALHAVLGTHFYRDGSYLYVVDHDGILLYHPQPALIGQHMADNDTIAAVMAGGTGERRTVNREGIEMLTGYAPIATTGWGVVAQRPTLTALQDLNRLTWLMVRNSMPVLIVTLLVIWWLSKLIARPLRDLASVAKQLDETEASEQLREIHSWYYEAEQIKRALLAGLWNINYKIHNLQQESTTDSLSGLLNRRGLMAALDPLRLRPESVSIIAVDIDHFKVINDTFGHSAGDGIIRLIAALMRRISRNGDIVARVGGEEFVLLLPRTNIHAAARVAERLRATVQTMPNPTACTITISAGIAHFPDSGQSLDAALTLADDALYYAKKNGRNMTCFVDANVPGGFAIARSGPDDAGDAGDEGGQPSSHS